MNAILFDLDGTLIDSTEGILQSFNYAFDSEGFTRAKKEDICSLVGFPLEIMLEKLGVPEDRISVFISRFKEKYCQISTQKTKLLPYAREAIKLAASFAHVGLVTTKTGEYSEDILKYFDVAKYFKTIVGREHVVSPKPNAEPILKALENLNVKCDKNSYMIGDTTLDVMAAKNAGISSIALLGGYGKKEDLESCCDLVVQNCLEAVKLLSQKDKILK